MWRAVKYLVLLTIPIGAYVSFWSHGWWSFYVALFTFILIPLAELLIKPDAINMTAAEEEIAKNDSLYDVILYIFVPIQFFLIFSFLTSISLNEWSTFEIMGKISAMGIICAITGINLGHELGHRNTVHERTLAKACLLSSMYMHFYIEHNRGHHKYVSTLEDPASARQGEWVFSFWIRSISKGYYSAWQLEASRLKRLNVSPYSWKNEMIQFTVIQLSFLLIIFWSFGLWPVLAFLLSAFVGVLLLETVNYIEHYGLQRGKNRQGKYEPATPMHSWNSDHVVGRLFLFELSRHSDHHYKTNRKYQILRHFDESPQMPTGYPGMVILALVPPLWFLIMDTKIKHLKAAKIQPRLG